MIDVLSRRVPRHHWVWLVMEWHRGDQADLESGGPQYGGALRRHTWRLGPVRVVVLRMPRGPDEAT